MINMSTNNNEKDGGVTKQTKLELLPHFLLVLSQFINSGMTMFTRVGVEDLNPLTFACFRLFIATMFLVPAARVIEGPWKDKLKKKHKYMIFSLSFLLFAQFITISLALERITASAAALIIPVVVINTTIIAVLLKQETITFLKGSGLLIALVGVAYVIDIFNTDLGDSGLIGNILLLLNTLSGASYFNLQNILMKDLSQSVHTMKLTSLFAIPLGLFVFFISVDFKELENISLIAVFALLFGGIGQSGINFCIMLWAIREIKQPSVVAAYILLLPVISGVLGKLILDEELKNSQIIGGIIILIGLSVIIYSKYQLSKGKIKNDTQEVVQNEKGHSRNHGPLSTESEESSTLEVV